MIRIICSKETFLYNAYHIVKAFLPSEEIKAEVEEKASLSVCTPAEEFIRLEMNGDVIKVYGEDKRTLDIALYEKLKDILKIQLPWGILTGVRPTKLAMAKLEEGKTEEEYISWIYDRARVGSEKAALSYEVAEREKKLLDQLDYEDGYSLYIGIPFCPSVCSYCSFSSGELSAWSDHVEAYVDALCKELIFIANASKEKKLNTIYMGGGTPTTLSPAQMDRVLTLVEEHFSFEHLLEYTVEAGRPDSITREKLMVLKKHGIDRISINPQSMQQKTLDAIGRWHTVKDVYEAFALARELGFGNINMDLIAGLPGECLADMKDTLRQIENLMPDSLTVHSLAIKRASRLSAEDQKVNSTEIADMVDLARECAAKMGLVPYYLYRQKNIAGNFENVGYAKVDKAGIYNILIMEEKQSIIAAGAGAGTKIVLKDPIVNPSNNKKTKLVRLENVKAIDAYISRIDEMIERKGEWLWH